MFRNDDDDAATLGGGAAPANHSMPSFDLAAVAVAVTAAGELFQH